MDARGDHGLALPLGKPSARRPTPTCPVAPGRLRGGGRRPQAVSDPPLLRGLRHLRPGLRPHHGRLPLLQVGPGAGRERGRDSPHARLLS